MATRIGSDSASFSSGSVDGDGGFLHHFSLSRYRFVSALISTAPRFASRSTALRTVISVPMSCHVIVGWVIECSSAASMACSTRKGAFIAQVYRFVVAKYVCFPAFNDVMFSPGVSALFGKVRIGVTLML
jgi:hypothetical protein